MKLTRKARYEIYKTALELIEEGRLRNYPKTGLCRAILEAILILNANAPSPYQEEHYNSRVNLEFYPELLKQKPEITYNDNYWFRPGNWEDRIKLLKQAIKETR